MSRPLYALAALLCLGPLQATDLPLPMAAKLLQLISKGAGENGRVACKNADMAAELTKIGSEVNAYGKVAWAGSVEEVRALALAKKCVVANDPKGLQLGASLAIYEEGGKPKVALNPKNLSGSGVTLSDAILKVALAQ